MAINASDPSQKVYTLAQANPDIVAGRCGKPSRQAAARYRPAPPLPAAVLQRAPHCRRRDRHHIRARGYVSVFTTSSDTTYTFTSLCLDPGTGNIVIVGQEKTANGPVGVVERLIPPARGSGTAALDTSFNPSSSESHTERTRPPVSSGFEKTNGWSQRRLENLPIVTQRRKGFVHLKRHLCQECSYC